MGMETTVGFSMEFAAAVTRAAQTPDALRDALVVAAETSDPERAAAAAEQVINGLAPALSRVAAIYAASWPTPAVDPADLLHEAMAAVLAGLSLAPRHTWTAAAAWCSAEAFRALHALYDAARGSEMTAPNALAVDEPADPRLLHVLRQLAPREAQVLQLRSAGVRWGEVADHFGVSTATVRRLYARALATARAVAVPHSHAA
jgi:RNA polymerase sigma factor (sigma-70 family)